MGKEKNPKRIVSFLFLLFLCTSTKSKDADSRVPLKEHRSSQTTGCDSDNNVDKDDRELGSKYINFTPFNSGTSLNTLKDTHLSKFSNSSTILNQTFKNSVIASFDNNVELPRGSFSPNKLVELPSRFINKSKKKKLKNGASQYSFSDTERNIFLTHSTKGNEYSNDVPTVEEAAIILIPEEVKSKHRSKRRVVGNLFGKVGTPTTTPVHYRNPLEKGRKHSGGNPNIDDIIQGIMKLLGGNVKLTASESRDTRLTTFGNNPSRFITSTRINNRGPPRLPILPFGFLPPVPGLTRPPIRLPVTPPTGIDSNRPQFVANTRPPFLVPLPPALSARPTMSKPFVTGIPIPEDVLSNIPSSAPEDDSNQTDAVTAVSPSFSDAIEVNTIDNPQEDSGGGANLDHKESQEKPVTTSVFSSEVIPVTSSSSSSSSPTPPLESSITSPSSNTVTENSGTKPSVMKSINLIASKKSSGLQNMKLSPTLVSSLKASHLNDVLPTVVQKSSLLSQSVISYSSKKFLKEVTASSLKSVPLSSSSYSEEIIAPSSSSSVNAATFFSLPPTTAVTLSNPFTPVSSSTSPFKFGTLPTRLPGPIRPFATTGHPGLVMADTIVSSSVYQGQLITANPIRPFNIEPDVFDVTVSASQGYGSPVQPPPLSPPPKRYSGNVAPLITTAKRPEEGSVFIDGRKTYFDLTPPSATGISQVQTMGVGTVIPEAVVPPSYVTHTHSRPTPPSYVTHTHSRPTPPSRPNSLQRPTRPSSRRPATLGPPKRIDTCIVGYDTTCKEELGEVCRTEGDVSSCFCRPGTARKRARTKCKKSVLLHLSLKVDRVGERRIVWGGNYANPEAKEYQLLLYEAEKALDSALGQSRGMSGLYMDSSVNRFYSLGGRVIVNSTIKLLHTPQTASPNIRKNLQRHLIRVIKTNNNYVGNSILAVEGPLNPVPDVSDVNECFDSSLYDCHDEAVCTNTFGSYTCVCKKGFTDRYPDDSTKSGRYCDSCSRDFCAKRGECRIEAGQNVCICEDSFHGARCEIDGEVIAVAVGASVAAVVIIILTLVFLCMWSQRWKAQDRKTEILSRLPGGLFGGWRGRGGVGREAFSVDIHQKGGPTGTYGVTMEDRIRWAHMADTLAHQNVYAPSTSVGNVDPSSSALGISALQRLKALHEEGQQKGGVINDVLHLFKRRGQKPKAGFPRMTPEEALTLHQMITLQAQLNLENQPEQIRSTPFYQDQRKILPPTSEYASVGTFSAFPQQFGMQHFSPPFMPQTHVSKAHSTYGQFGPPSLNSAPSIGGVSRAPTMGARTPLPVRDLLGEATTMGPLGGGIATKSGNCDMVGALLTSSSEEDQERPYHLPRPMSRSSALDNDDFYYDPDDMMTSQSRLPPLPSSPPPPVPYFQFDQFFKSKFP